MNVIGVIINMIKHSIEIIATVIGVCVSLLFLYFLVLYPFNVSGIDTMIIILIIGTLQTIFTLNTTGFCLTKMKWNDEISIKEKKRID